VNFPRVIPTLFAGPLEDCGLSFFREIDVPALLRCGGPFFSYVERLSTG